MKVIDLTHYITSDMPVYPGTEGPSLTAANTYEKDGFKETLISMYSHTGTHIDSPAHIFEGSVSLDGFDVSQFIGRAFIIDCSDLSEGGSITADMVRPYEDELKRSEFVVFKTGWDKYWGKDEYYGLYPCIDMDTASFIASLGLKGVGLDTIGLDPIQDEALPRHRTVLQDGNMIIIENLTNLGLIPYRSFTLAVFPLKYRSADGSPVRAVALLDEQQ